MRVGVLEIQLLADMARLSKDMKQAERTVSSSMSQVERSVAGAKRAMQSLGVGVPVALIVDQVRRITDQYTKLDAQLQLTTKSQAQYAQGLSDIRRISTIAQTDISATSMLYTRLMNVMDGTGVSQAKLATVTETVSYGLKAYGATAQEAASASLQLSQAMGANRLGGEEFRAVMEAMPNVMKVLAKSMGVPLGELRALSIAGKITAEEMIKAFGDPAIAEEFRKLALNAQTVTGAWTVARNELMLLVGEFMKSSGATGGLIAVFNGLAGVIRLAAQYLDQIIAAFTIWAAVSAGRVVVALVQARMAQMALNTSTLASAEAAYFAAKANLAGAAAAARAGASMKVAAAAAREYAVASEQLAAAQMSTAGRIKGAVGKAGWLGMAIFGIWSVVDFLNGMQAVADGAKKTAADLSQLSLSEAMSARQKVLIERLDMERSFKGADRYRVEIRDANLLIEAYDKQIGTLVQLGKEKNAPSGNLAFSGDDKVLMKQLVEYQKQLDDASITQVEYNSRVHELYARIYPSLIASKKDVAKVLKEESAAQRELRAMQEASVKYQQDIVDGINAETDALVKKIEQERFDLAAIGKTQEELALLQSVRYDNVTALQEQKLATLEAVYASEEEIAALREQIKARKELKGVWSAQATAQAQETQKKAWKEVWDSVDKTAHDTFVSILNGGKDTATRLKEAFKNGFFDWLYSMTVKKWIVNISGVAGGVGAAGSAMAGVTGGGGATSWLSAGSNMGAETLGNSIMSNIAPLTTAASYLGAGLAGIGVGTALAGDKKLGGMDGQTLATIGAIAGSFVPVIGTFLGGAIGGALAGAFGRGPKVSGTTMLAGEFGAGGFAGQYETPWSQKGGWFSSGRSGVDVQGIGAEQAQAFQDVIAGTEFVFAKLAAVSGEATTALDTWSFAINRQVATQEQQEQLVIDIANSMGAHMIPRLSQFQKEGENLADTAVRLSDEVILLNKLFYALGSTSRATMDSADQLANALGGVGNSAQLMTDFIATFAPAEQQTALTLEALVGAGLPMAQFLTTTEAWWAFAQTASTEQLAAILANQGAIKSWVDAMDKSSQAVKDNIKALQDKSIADFKAASDAVASLRTFGASVRDLMGSLWLGAQSPSGASSGASLAEFLRTNRAAAGGDVTARGNLAGSATAFLDVAKSESTSKIEYARVFAMVQNELAATADATDVAVSVADRQLIELQQANAWLTAIAASNQTQSLSALLGAASTSAGAVNDATGANQIAVIQQAAGAAQSIADAQAQADAVARAAADAAALANPVYSATNPNPANVAAKAEALAAYQRAQDEVASYTGRYRPKSLKEAAATAKAAYDALPAFATGVNAGVLPSDMILQAHGGEEIKPRQFVDLDRTAREETNALLRRLVDTNNETQTELRAARVELADIRRTNQNMDWVTDKWDNDGTPPVRT